MFNFFSVSEYVEGGDLFDLSEKYGALPEELVKIYVAELGSALGIYIIGLKNYLRYYRNLDHEKLDLIFL